MATLNGLPVYQIKISEDLANKTGIDFISLVDYPAIETNWVAMGDHKKPMKFNADKAKQLLCGPILIPDLPIYRFDKDLGEYYVVFSPDEIEKIVRKFQASQKTINLNYQHQKDSQLKQAVVQEIWLTGEKDKSHDLGFDLPAKTAFVCTHIGDKDFWDNEVATGNVRGFSIEGFLDMEMKKIINTKMSNQKFSVYKIADGGGEVYVDGDLVVDNYVFSNYPSVTLVDGKKQITQYPVWQNTIVLDDGTILTLNDSKILKIEKKQGMSNQKLADAKTSDGKTLKTTAETFQVGGDATVIGTDGKEIPAEGEYTLDNGDVITCAAGKITAVNQMDLSTEEEEIVQQAALKKIQPILDAYEKRIAELEAKLSAIPGARSATDDDDDEKGHSPTQLSKKKKLLGHLEVLRKKDKEFQKNNSKK